jgi:hypothetical protein
LSYAVQPSVVDLQQLTLLLRPCKEIRLQQPAIINVKRRIPAVVFHLCVTNRKRFEANEVWPTRYPSREIKSIRLESALVRPADDTTNFG